MERKVIRSYSYQADGIEKVTVEVDMVFFVLNYWISFS